MTSTKPQELAVITQARRMLDQATTFEEITAIRDRAELARTYARTVRAGLDLQNQAAELKLPAERKAGELLAGLRLRGGDRRSKRRREGPMLKEIGISKDQSQRWQLLASVPERIFRQYVDTTTRLGQEVAAAPLLRIARQLRPAKGPRPVRIDNDGSPSAAGGIQAKAGQAVMPLEFFSEMNNHCQVLVGLLEPGSPANEPLLDAAQIRHIRRLVSDIASILQAIKAGNPRR